MLAELCRAIVATSQLVCTNPMPVEDAKKLYDQTTPAWEDNGAVQQDQARVVACLSGPVIVRESDPEWSRAQAVKGALGEDGRLSSSSDKCS